MVGDPRRQEKRSSANSSWPQLIEEHGPYWGSISRFSKRVHRRALRALVPVAASADRSARTAGGWLRLSGAGAQELGARVRQQQPGASARRRAQHRSGGVGKSGHRTDREKVLRASISAAAVHLHARARSPRPRSPAHAGDVAALPERRDRTGEGRPIPLGPRSVIAPFYTKARHALRLLAPCEWVRLVYKARVPRRASIAPLILQTLPIYSRAGSIVPSIEWRTRTSPSQGNSLHLFPGPTARSRLRRRRYSARRLSGLATDPMT